MALILLFANAGFHLLHLLVIGFNLFGWLWQRTRCLCLALQMLTLAFWLGFGLWRGWWGYCPLTDWHWQVLRNLGQNNLPASYIEYLLEVMLQQDLDPGFISGLTLGTLLMALVASVYVNVIAIKRR